MMTPEPWMFSLCHLLNLYAIYLWLLEHELVYDKNLYAFSLLSIIFGLCFIRQHLMAYKPNCQETLNASVYRPVIYMACCMWDYGKIIQDNISFTSRQFPKVKSISCQVLMISLEAVLLKGSHLQN